MDFAEFILAHDADDLGALALARDRYAGDVEDFDLAITTLECRRKLRCKVPEWYAVPGLYFPLRISAEQCSSTETAMYKAVVALANSNPSFNTVFAGFHSPAGVKSRILGKYCEFSLADLTGGLGVDSWAFSKVASQVLYNEMQPSLAAAAEHNFALLGVDNIKVRNCTVEPGCVKELLDGFTPDVIYLDPARRASDGRKVFRLEDCQPNVLELLPELFAAAPHVLLKLSPMADISLVCKQLGSVKAVHVVAAEGECKELLLLLERGYEGEYELYVYESGAVMLVSGTEVTSLNRLRFASALPTSDVPIPLIRPRMARDSVMSLPLPEKSLFEPGKGLLKAGAFELPCEFGLEKLGKHTHLYVGEAVPEGLRPLGKSYEIVEVVPLNNKTIRELGVRYPQAEVTARNVPLSSDDLRRKIGCRSGGQVHIFGVHIDALNGNFLMIVK